MNKEFSYHCRNQDTSDEKFLISEIFLLKTDFKKKFLYLCLSVFSFGLVYLVGEWLVTFKLFLKYTLTDKINEASHFLLRSQGEYSTFLNGFH